MQLCSADLPLPGVEQAGYSRPVRVGFLLGICLFGCSDAALVVDVDLEADSCALALAQRLEVRVLNGSGQLLENFDAAAVFPTGVRLSADASQTEWRMEATLYDANDVILAELSADGTFEDGIVSRRFEDACLGIVCGDGESCSGGLCVSEEEFTSAAAAPAPAECPAWLFVSTEGSDEGECGSFETPCASLGPLAESGGLLIAGGIVNIAAGTYGSALLNRSYGGPVVIRGLPGNDAPVFDAQGDNDALAIEGSDVTLQDLVFRGGLEHGISVNMSMTMRQERIRIRRCEVRGNGITASADGFDNRSGIHFNNNVIDFVVEDSTIEENDGAGSLSVHGIYINKASDGLLRRNRFVANRSGGIFIADSTNVEVRESVFLSNGPQGVVADTAASTRFEGNRFCGHSESGIRSSSALPTEVVRNTFVGNAVGIVRLSPNGGMLNYEHNVFLGQSAAAVEFQTSTALPPNDGINLYFENGSLTEGFERSSPDEDIQEDPMLSGLEECALTRATPDPYPEFGSL